MRIFLPILSVLALAAPARAQMTATILSIGDRATLSPPTPLTTAMNLAECQLDARVTVRVDNIPATATNLDFWAGAGCSDASIRSSTTDGSCNCLSIDFPTRGATSLDVSTSVGALLGIGRVFRGTSTTRSCSTIGLDDDAIWPVVVLGVTTPCSVETTSAYADVGDGTHPQFTVDTTPPLAPEHVMAGDGDTAVPVAWTPAAGVGVGGGNTFVVLGSVAEESDGGSCSSTTLVAGGTAPLTPVRTGTPGLHAAYDASTTVPCGATGAIAVVTVDDALNVSPLSNVACFVHTAGVGTCAPPPMPPPSGCCAVDGAPALRSGALAFGLVLTTLIGCRRRRRHGSRVM